MIQRQRSATSAHVRDVTESGSRTVLDIDTASSLLKLFSVGTFLQTKF